LIVYINLNPIYHGFTGNIYSYRYSSLLTLLSKGATAVKYQQVWDLFHGKENFLFYINQKKFEFDEKMNALILE